VWAVSNDPVDKLKAYAGYAKISFPLLSDATLSVVRAYGIYNERQDLAHPTTIVIDRTGVVRYVREDVDFRVRPSADEVLAAVRKLPAK
jgi:peroxiredoxin